MTSNGKQFTVTREMLTAVAGISARYSKSAFILFCYITNHLMTGPRISMFLSTSSRETLRFSGNKIHCSPRDQSLSVYCYTSQLKYVFGIGGERVTCRGLKLTNFLGRIKITNSIGKLQLELWTRT